MPCQATWMIVKSGTASFTAEEGRFTGKLCRITGNKKRQVEHPAFWELC